MGGFDETPEPVTQWMLADRAAAALQAHVDETKGIGWTIGDEGSKEWGDNVVDLLVNLKHEIWRADPEMTLESLCEEAVERWAVQSDEIPAGGPE